jgi:hypothetical protein
MKQKIDESMQYLEPFNLDPLPPDLKTENKTENFLKSSEFFEYWYKLCTYRAYGFIMQGKYSEGI